MEIKKPVVPIDNYVGTIIGLITCLLFKDSLTWIWVPIWIIVFTLCELIRYLIYRIKLTKAGDDS